jgi:outer membrane lipoprotein carrier protein
MKIIVILLLFFALEAFPCEKEVEEVLNNIKTFQADFLEESYQEDKVFKKEGRIFIKKPGLMKLDYFIPEKISIYVKGKNIIHYDYNLEEVSYLSDKDSYLDFLSKEEISLKKDFDKSLCKIDDNMIKLLLKREKLTMELLFKEKILSRILIYLEESLVDKITFLNEEINLQLKDDIFLFKDKKFLQDE